MKNDELITVTLSRQELTDIIVGAMQGAAAFTSVVLKTENPNSEAKEALAKVREIQNAQGERLLQLSERIRKEDSSFTSLPAILTGSKEPK